MQRRALIAGAALTLAIFTGFAGAPVKAETAAELEAKSKAALDSLLGQNETAKVAADAAKGILIFPSIVKAGFGIGGEFGEGALFKGGNTDGFYNIASASFGLQIGAQAYSQALFFMTDDALNYLDASKGFEIGADAAVAVASKGAGYELDTNNIQDPIIAFVFGESGLMAGITLEGSKITQIDKE